MVGDLREAGWIRSEQVAKAFRTVPRHLSAPGTPLPTAYATQDSLPARSDAHGQATSVVSAPPYLQAMMLEQAEPGPGMRALEIGAGGYNAALIAELVGEPGQVNTADLDPEVVTGTGTAWRQRETRRSRWWQPTQTAVCRSCPARAGGVTTGVESGPVIDKLMRLADDNCGTTCETACSATKLGCAGREDDERRPS